MTDRKNMDEQPKKPKFFSCFQVDTRTKEVTDLGKHPGPSAKEVADTLASALSESCLVTATSEDESAAALGKVSGEASKDPHFIVFIGDSDVWVTIPGNEADFLDDSKDSEKYDRKEVYSPDLHITLRPVVSAENLVWTPI